MTSVLPAPGSNFDYVKQLFLSAFCLLVWSLLGQNDSISVLALENAPDSAFAQARELAFAKEYDAAEKMLRFLHQQYPKNPDYPLFLARVESWQKNYAESRSLLKPLLTTDSAGLEAARLLTLVERYDQRYDTALALSDSGLVIAPGDRFFLTNKAHSQIGLLRYPRALETVDTALTLYPRNKELQALKQFLLNQLIAEGLAVGAGVDYFTSTFDPWINGLVQYGHFTGIGAILARLNYANRFDENGYQFEMDAYPQLGKGRYLYLNAGYSPSEIFPRWRLGGEFFSILPGTSFELSLGYRYLLFGQDNTVGMWTGSLGWYFGNHYLQLRPFFINQEVEIGSSYNLIYRKFFTGMGDFVQVSAGFGFIPDQRIIQLGGVVGEELYVLDNRYLGFAYQKLLSDAFYARADLTFTNQEQFGVPGDFYSIVSLFVTLGYRL